MLVSGVGAFPAKWKHTVSIESGYISHLQMSTVMFAQTWWWTLKKKTCGDTQGYRAGPCCPPEAVVYLWPDWSSMKKNLFGGCNHICMSLVLLQWKLFWLVWIKQVQRESVLSNTHLVIRPIKTTLLHNLHRYKGTSHEGILPIGNNWRNKWGKDLKIINLEDKIVTHAGMSMGISELTVDHLWFIWKAF